MTAAPPAALDALREAMSPGTERDPAAYLIDDVAPAAAFEPTGREELATLLGRAAGHALAVTPQGSRTALAMGRPLDAYDLAIDMRGLRRTVEYVPDDLTVTVEAGRRLGALQAELAEHGQYLPIDPPPDDDVTIGGLLATARPGAWRGHLPAARDLILGMQVALPSGDLVRSGGRVVKNVTGYDLQRLQTGALGAFGVIVEATFKVAPLPAATLTSVATAPTLASATALAQRIWDASPALRALTVLAPGAASRLGLPAQPSVLLELAGTTPAVERSARDLGEVAPLAEAPPEAWAALRRLHGDATETVVRAGVPPTSIVEVMDTVEALGGTGWAHIAPGAVVARFEGDAATEAAVEQLRQRAEQYGGFIVVESAPIHLRQAIEPSTGDAVLVRALRDRFDPRRTVNRGRWGATL